MCWYGVWMNYCVLVWVCDESLSVGMDVWMNHCVLVCVGVDESLCAGMYVYVSVD